MTLDFSERLFSLLVSPYSFIQIRTYEEQRIVQLLKALAGQLKRAIVEWSPGTVAFRNPDGQSEPRAALVELFEAIPGAADGAIVVLKDPHPYLDDPRVVRAMRELEPHLTASNTTVVMVSPYVELPRELLKDVTFLDAPLPGRVELAAVLDEVYPPDKEPTLPRQRMVSAALGLTLREARRAYHRAHFERRQAQRQRAKFDIEAAVVSEKRRLIEADRILEFVDLLDSLSDIGGLDNLKLWMGEREQAFSEAAAEFGLPTPRGLLLTGVQGCGKSLFAKAVASYWGVPLLRLDIVRLFDGQVPPEAALQRAIQTAEALSPAVLYIDEIDKAFGEGTGGSVNRMMGRLLSWLQDKTQPVFFVATANRVRHLPPELLRKGRFDEVFFVDLPRADDRAEIFRIHLARREREPSRFDIDALTKHTEFFSGAEIEQVVVSGLFKAFAKGRDLVQADLEAAIAETIPLYRTYEEDIKGLREWAATRARPATRDKTLLDYFRKG